jgi:hypothetical protein
MKPSPPLTEVEKLAKDWMEMIRPMVAAANQKNERFIIKMDQTPVLFQMSEGTTLEVEGSKTVDARSSMDQQALQVRLLCCCNCIW